MIVELGYRSSGTLSREKFFQTKAELFAARNIDNKQGIEGEEENGVNNTGNCNCRIFESFIVHDQKVPRMTVMWTMEATFCLKS